MNLNNYLQTFFYQNAISRAFRRQVIKIEVKNDNLEQALRVLKKKLQKEGTFRILKLKSHFEKPSEKKKREKEENEKRFKKIRKLKARL